MNPKVMPINFRLYLICACVLLTVGCASSLYVEQVAKQKYLVEIYNLADSQTANLRWQEKTDEICNGNVLKDNVTITLETHDGPDCESCGLIKSYKKGTYSARGTVECQ